MVVCTLETEGIIMMSAGVAHEDAIFRIILKFTAVTFAEPVHSYKPVELVSPSSQL